MKEEQEGTRSAKKSATTQRLDTWWVRNDLSSQYGPVDLQTLRQWAREGRIAPSGEISSDGVNWSAAVSNPSLEMEWLALFPDGHFYGPVHLDVLNELKTGELWVPGTVSYRQMDGKSAQANPSQKELQLQINAMEAQSRQQEIIWEDAAERWKDYETTTVAEIEDLSAQLKESRSAVQREHKKFAGLKRQSEEKIASQAWQISELQQALQQSKEKEESLIGQFASLQNQRELLSRQVEEQKTDLEKLRETVSEKTVQMRALTDNIAALEQLKKTLKIRLEEAETALSEGRTCRKQNSFNFESEVETPENLVPEKSHREKEPVVLDAVILSEKTLDSDEQLQSDLEKKQSVFTMGEKIFTKMKQTVEGIFRKKEKPTEVNSLFSGKNPEALEALEQQLQRELSHLGKNSNNLFK